MHLRFSSVAIVMASAGYAHAAVGADEKAGPLLIGSVPPSTWSRPALVTSARAVPAARAQPTLASFLPTLPSSFFGNTDGASRLLFLSPLSPLRSALRVAAQDLAAQTLIALAPATDAASNAATVDGDGAIQATSDAVTAKRREVVLRQRRKSVLNERSNGERSEVATASPTNYDVSGLSGRVELLALPSTPPAKNQTDGALPNGAGLVRVAGYLTDDLSFAVTGLAAESAATTWRAGAEFELAAGDRNRIEVGAVYGTRFNAASLPLQGEIDHRSVGAFRLIHAIQLSDTVSVRSGGRFVDASFLKSGRSIDPELSFLVEEPEGGESRTYLRLDMSGDTLFPGLEVVAGESDLAMSEGLPVFSRQFEAQRTWNRAAAIGYREKTSRFEARLQDQTVTHALLVLPSSVAGAPFVRNGSRNRVQIGSVSFEKTFARGQAQAEVEYGYGRFAKDQASPSRQRDFHQVTSRIDAYFRRTGTGLAIFHRLHEGAEVSSSEGSNAPRLRAQRYLVELRQDVPFVPSMIGADMALLVSLRNVYYDDVERRNIDEFAVSAPPRRITGGIRVKF